MKWRFPARAETVRAARRAVVAYDQAPGVGDAHALALAISEAVSNAVVHAYIGRTIPGAVEVIAVRHPDDGLEVHVCDDGRGMTPRVDSPGIGAGLPLIARVSDHLEIETTDNGGPRVRMTFAAATA